MSIEHWTSNNYLTFNMSKCSYMMISRKRYPTLPPHPLMLNGQTLKKVECFKYLGLLLSSDLSWTPHITSICSKAKRLLGLLYRRFYNFVEDRNTLKQLYLSLVRPHLEYACPVWDPHTVKDQTLLENVQKFALRMASKQWDSGYQDLLDLENIASLADRRLELKLALLYRIVHGLCYFPPDIFLPRTNYSHRTNHSLLISVDSPAPHTSSISGWHPLTFPSMFVCFVVVVFCFFVCLLLFLYFFGLFFVCIALYFPCHCTFIDNIISQPFAHTNAYYYSFVPHTISVWNSLCEAHVTAPSISVFKNYFTY